MNSRVAILLLVICAIAGLTFLEIRREMPESQTQPNTSPIASSILPPIVRPAAGKPKAGEQPKSNVSNEPKPEEETRNPVLEDDVRNNPLKQKPKSNRPVSKKRLESLSSPEDVNLFLDDLRFDTLEYFYHDAFLWKEDPQHPDLNLNNVKGTFAGPVKILETQQKIWDMRMEYDGFKDQIREVRTRIEVSEDGQNYRHLPGYNYRNIDYLGFIIEPSINDYVEMFYLPQKDVFIGNWYSGSSTYRSHLFTMKPKGTMILQRVQ